MTTAGLPPTHGDATSEATSTVGLMLMVGAVVGFALALSSFTLGGGSALWVMALATASFTASLVCFVVDAQRSADAEVASSGQAGPR